MPWECFQISQEGMLAFTVFSEKIYAKLSSEKRRRCLADQMTAVDKVLGNTKSAAENKKKFTFEM